MRRRQSPEERLDSESINALVDSMSLPDVKGPGKVRVSVGQVQELGRTPKEDYSDLVEPLVRPDAPVSVSSSGTPRGMLAEAMKGAMGPSAAAKAAPKMPGSTPSGNSMELTPEQQEQVMAAARKRADEMGLFDSWGRNLSSAADLISGRKAAPIDTDSTKRRAELMGDAESRVARAKQYAAERMGLAEKAEAKQRLAERDRIEADERQYGRGRDEMKDRLSADERQYERTRQTQLDERQARLDKLQEQKTRAEIARMGRPAGSGDPMIALKRELEIKKLQKELGEEAADPLAVPGFTRPEGSPGIKVEEAKGMRELVAADGAAKNAIARMREAKEDTGREFWPGADKDTQEGVGAELILGIKELGHTGALDVQSERIARSMVPGPSEGAAASKAKLNQLENYLNARVNSRAGSLGYKKDAPPAERAGMPVERGPVNLDQAPRPAAAKHDEALQWAKANPNDPRAQRILKLNGVR